MFKNTLTRPKAFILACLFIFVGECTTCYGNPAVTANISNESDAPIIELSAEENKAASGNEVINLNVQQNIFNIPVKKEFKSGFLRDIKLVGGQDVMIQHLFQKGQNRHTLGNGKISVWGVKGHFRDEANTSFLVTLAPTLDVPRYGRIENQFFEYYITRPLNEHTQLRIGQQRTANLVEGSRSIFRLNTGRRARYASKFSNITAIGAQLFGNYDRFEYRAGIFDSGRFMKYNFDDMPEVAGMFTLKPIKDTEKYGTLKVGTSYNVGHRGTSYNVVGAHAIYDYKKFHLDSEFAYANGYSSRVISEDKAYGYHVTTLYDIHPKVTAFCRLDHLNPNTDLHNVSSNEYSAGFHYYLKGEKARITLSYIFLDNKIGYNSNRIFTMLELLP